MKTDIVIDISQPIPYLTKFWFSSYGLKYCQAVKFFTQERGEWWNLFLGCR